MASDDHPPAFQFYPRDFAADSKVEVMTTEAVGAYWLICCKAWYEDPPGTIPDDDFILRRWARLGDETWDEVKELVLSAFTKGDDGRWHQKRMEREYKGIMERRQALKSAGKKGAEKRWGAHSQAIYPAKGGHGQAYATAMAIDSSASATASAPSTPTAKEKEKGSAREIKTWNHLLAFKENLPKSHHCKSVDDALVSWITHRAEKRNPLTPQTIILQAKSLGEMTPEEAIATLERSIKNGWLGLFDNNTSQKTSGKSSTPQHRLDKAAREYPESLDLPVISIGSKKEP